MRSALAEWGTASAARLVQPARFRRPIPFSAFRQPFCAAYERAKTPIREQRVQVSRTLLMFVVGDQLEHGFAGHHVLVRETRPTVDDGQSATAAANAPFARAKVPGARPW